MWPLIAGAAIGAAAGMLGRNKDKTATTRGSSSSSGEQYAVPPTGSQPIYDVYTAELLNAARTPLQYYPGQGYVGPSDATKQAWDLQQGAIPYYTGGAEMAAKGVPLYGQGAEMMMKGTDPMMQGAGMTYAVFGQQQAMLGTSNANYNTLSNAADVANNPYVQGQLAANERSVNKQLTEQWLPAVNSGAVGGKSMGSSRQGMAQGQAVGDAAEALAQQNAATMLGAYGQGLGAQQYALGQTGAMLGAQAMPAQTVFQGGQMMGAAGQQAAGAGAMYGQGAAQLGQAGDLQQQAAGAAYGTGASQEMYSQRELDDAMARWNFAQMEPWQRLQMTQGGLGAYTPYAHQYQTGSSNSLTTGPNPGYQSPFQAALGGAAMGAGIASGFGGGGGGYPTTNPYYNPAMATNPMYGYRR